MSGSLPPNPSLENLRKQAKQLVKDHKAAKQDACERIQRFLPRLHDQPSDAITETRVTLQEAQHVIACENGFTGWSALVEALRTGNGDKPLSPIPYLLRITSKEKDAEVEFEGAFMVADEKRSYHNIVQRTPFEFRAEAQMISGLFRATSGNGDLQVELIGPLNNEIKPLLTGSGRHFVIGKHTWNTPGDGFIWVF